MDGHITLTGQDAKGVSFKRLATIRDGEVWDSKIIKNGKTVYHIAYGKFEKEGNTIVRFHKGTGKGKHGKARRFEKLFGSEGVCHSWYKNGRLTRQKFIYSNNKTAYDYNAYGQHCVIKDAHGNILYEVTRGS